VLATQLKSSGANQKVSAQLERANLPASRQQSLKRRQCPSHARVSVFRVKPDITPFPNGWTVLSVEVEKVYHFGTYSRRFREESMNVVFFFRTVLEA
jgi:hypothetical protein